MQKCKNFVCSILILLVLIYYALGIFLNNKIYATTARNRELSLDNLTEENYPGIATLINNLKKDHPNWTFTILYTGLNWNDVIYNETAALHGRSLVQNNNSGWVCSTCGTRAYDNGTWYCASPATVSYYMDVRNWLTENYIFAFETLSYDSGTQTIDGVKKILSGTFLDKDVITYYDCNGNAQTINKSYAQIIMEAGTQTGVSPYHLASRLRQEQGVSGTSGLISGKYNYTDTNGNIVYDLQGYYNYFNIGAGGNGTTTIIKNGLTKAKEKGWTTPELAIKGGAEFIATAYIKNYQDSLYLEKYQVDSLGGLYNHQYMQNVSAPFTEGYSTYTAYKNLDMLNYSFNFIIPVYENMPETISPMPNAVAMNVVTENVKVTTAYSALKIRGTASSSGELLGSVDKGTVLLRIEKATAISSDNRYWDKIVYNNGNDLIIGYAARIDTDGSQYLTPVDDVVTVNEQATTTTVVNLRNGPGIINTQIKKTISNNVDVTIIDKMNFKVNNYYWYRVKLSDGTQGYIASEYLQDKVEESDNQNGSSTQTIKNCKIDGSNLIIVPGTKITDIEGAKITGDIIGTGVTINVNDNTYTLVVLGDVSGDGEVDARDSARILKYSIGQYELNNAQKKAADVSKDLEIDARDSARILKYSINQFVISL